MGVRSGSHVRRTAFALTMAAALLAFGVDGAGAVAANGEYPGPAAGVTAPTAEKPESKLWFTDGTWWSVMITGTTGDHKIYRLNPDTQAWSDTGVTGRSPSAPSDEIASVDSAPMMSGSPAR